MDYGESRPVAKYSYIDPTGLHDPDLGLDYPFREVLPWPPSINNYYGRRPRGGIYLKKPGQKFRHDVMQQLLWCAQEESKWEPLKLLIDIYPPDKRRRDSDNITKAVMDGLEHAGAYKDDYLIFDFQVRKWGWYEDGMVIASIKVLTYDYK